MTIANELLSELERESRATRRLLERVPADKLEWRPHEKSMTLRDLAWHVATIPGRIPKMVAGGTFDVTKARPATAPTDLTNFADVLDQSVAEAKAILGTLDDEAIRQPFTMTRGSDVISSMPRVAALRAIMLNHSYHHRGQLTVYLRLLDVLLPATYGSSADERPV